MYTFTVPREKFDERAPDKQMIRQLISKHISIVGRMQKNMAYYKGQHEILSDADRENKLVCNHAKDISDTASSYFIGNPVTYKAEGDIKALTDALETAGADETDGDNGLELSIYGLAYEYVYIKENENDLVTKNLSAENTFMVKDDSIEERELFAVYYYVRKDDSGTSSDHFMATILTSRYRYELDIEDSSAPQITVEEPQEHYMCEIPIIEYLNNKLGIGDFELQIPLIDAYNALMSDRITDKEQFIDAILAIYGTLLADDEVDENGEFYRTADERKQASDTAYKASHLCSYSYFPQYNGTSDDGINANKPDGQAREFYDGLNSDVQEAFDAYGVKTYVEMLGTNDAPGDWYPMWSYSNNFNTSTPGGVAWTKIGEVKHEQLPQVVMAKNFDKAWDTYMDAYNACNPQDFLDELQTELDKRLEQAAKFK